MAANLTAKRSNYISRLAAAMVRLADIRDDLHALNDEFVAMGYSGTFVDGDFVGANAYLDANAVNGGLTSQANLETFWAAGNNMNISKFRP